MSDETTAAAEDVAGEAWTSNTVWKLEDGCNVIDEHGKYIGNCGLNAHFIVRAHNSCVGSLQEQIRTDQEKISELSGRIANIARLQRLTEDNQVRALERVDSMQLRAEEAEAKLAGYENRKPSIKA